MGRFCLISRFHSAYIFRLYCKMLIPTKKGHYALDRCRIFVYGIEQQHKTDTMTGKKLLPHASESCRPLRGNARENSVTGPRVFPLRRRSRLGGNGFPHRYQRGGIRTQALLRRADAGSGHFCQ